MSREESKRQGLRSAARQGDMDNVTDDHVIDPSDQTRTTSQMTSAQDNTPQIKPENQVEVMMRMFMQMNTQVEEQRRQAEEQRRFAEDQRRREEEQQRRQDEQAREERLQGLLTTMIQAQSKASERQSELEQRRLAFEEEQCRLNAERRATEDAQRKAQREKELKIHQTPKLPPMKDKMDIELYLEDFEVYMNELETPKERWASCLRPLLTEEARVSLDGLTTTEKANYSTVKDALIQFQCTKAGSLGARYFNLRREPKQSFVDFIHTALRTWRHWMKDADIEAAGHRVTMERVYAMLPLQCREYCRSQDPTTATDLGRLIHRFFRDRNSSPDDLRWKSQPRPWRKTEPLSQPTQTTMEDKPNNPEGWNNPIKPPPKQSSEDWMRNVQCYLCKEYGHVKAKCPKRICRVSTHTPQPTKSSLTVTGQIAGNQSTSIRLDTGAETSVVHSKIVPQSCYTGRYWSAKGAFDEYHSFPTALVGVEVDGYTAEAELIVSDKIPYDLLLGIDIPFWSKLMSKKLDEIETRQTPVVAVTTRAQDAKEKRQRQEDDLLSAISGVQPKPIEESTGLELLDDSLFAQPKESKQKLTRSARRKLKKERYHESREARLNLSTDELRRQQEEDVTLGDLWDNVDNPNSSLVITDDLLHHKSLDDFGEELDQLVVPQALREEVMSLAHGAPLSGHTDGRRQPKKCCSTSTGPN